MSVRALVPVRVLREDGEFVLYRETQDASPARILVLMPVTQQPAPASLRRLEHELSLAAELEPHWAVRPLELARRHGGRKVLLFADPGGELLGPAVGQPLKVREFLLLGIAITTALGQVHARGLIHKDIKPANILVNGGQAYLTGFGMASRSPRERQALQPPQILTGTLPYMAPEQTGRMNRLIDARSDLYSLGVTLFELLTGRLPFAAADPSEWVHCHIARRPPSPAEHAAVPEPLAAIILKLLAKSAAERYQGAPGLEADLRHCLAQWQRYGRIEAFVLGQQDQADRLVIPEILCGRERELAVLRSACERVTAEGTPVLMLVSGYAGVGKSALVHELHRELLQTGAWFAAGKFDQNQQDIPYATLGHALGGLVSQLLGRADTEVAHWRERLTAGLGDNAQLIVSLVPELELIIGPQLPAPEVPPQDVLNRFRRVFRRFLGVFAQPQRPLVLLLDDLQWVDAATADLLEHVLTQTGVRHVLVLGAYRDNAVEGDHSLVRRLAALRLRGCKVEEIFLAPLALDEVSRLVSDGLHCTCEHAQELAGLVFDKTHGNPFFAIQFLTALEEEGLLTRDRQRGTWQWDLQRIRAKGLTDNVAHLLVAKLNRLSPAGQQALQRIACVGNGAALEMLTRVLEAPEQAVHQALREAVLAGLIIYVERGYRFLHDRIQEAAYGLIPQSQRMALHLHIGRAIQSRLGPEQLEEHVFEIVGQLNRGRQLMTGAWERRALAELNLLAGRRARRSSAYAAALTYLEIGGELLPAQGWTDCPELAFRLELQRAECEFLTGALESAEARLAALAGRASNSQEAAEIACLRQTLYATLARHDRAIEVCLEYLRQVGITWTAAATQAQVALEYEQFWRLLGNRPVEELIELPVMSDPQQRATLDVLASVLAPALMTDMNLFRVVVGRMANLSLQYGHGDGSALAYVYLNVIVGHDRGDYASGLRFAQLAVELLDRGMHRFKARVEIAFGTTVLPWTRPFRSGLPWIRRSIDTAQESGDLTFACYSWFLLIPHLLGVEETLEDIQREAEHALEFARGMRFDYMVELLTITVGFLQALRGLTPELADLSHEGFDESACAQRLAGNPGLRTAALWYWLYKLQVCLHAEDCAAALAASAKARQYFWFTLTVCEQSDYHFYTALALAASHAGQPAGEQAGCREALASHAGALAALAANSVENFGPRASLVAAEIARLDGQESEASRLYEQAIRAARDSGFVRIEALAFELAARFYAARGLDIVGDDLLRNARSCYQRWGAQAKVRLLDRRNASLARESSAALVPATTRTPLEELDVLSVISAAQAVSSEIVLDDLITQLLRLAVEHAGAERGLLILVRDGKPLIEAEATTTGQDRVTVSVGRRDITPGKLSEAILHYVLRTQESVILDDATLSGLFSTDEYVRAQRPRSVLCQPLIKQKRLVGVLYLENQLAAGAFTARTAVLHVLSAQAAISLENAYLYADVRERENRIRHLIDSNVVGICFWTSGRITDANDAYCRLLGYSRAELLSDQLNWREKTPAEYHARDEQWVDDLRLKGTAATYEKEYFRKDGTCVPVLIGGAILPGAPHQGIAFALDLTERKQAELERGARLVAEEANRAKGEFLAKMSHELRTPLNGILGYAQILARDFSLGERQRDNVAVIQHSGEYLLALINDILDLAKIEAGKLGLEPGPLLLADFLQAIYRIILVQAQQKGVELVWETGPDLPTAVRADQRRLRQVLLNLLANAVKFTDRGRVGLSVTGPHSGKLRFEVRDTGIGISPEQLSALFQPFEQVGEGARRPEGTGLGLAISRQLVRMMGGDIRVDSRSGQGSCFWFELDMHLERFEAPMSARRQVMTGYKGPRKRVLVIDDVLENRSMLVDLLAPLGFEVIEAANGHEALDRLQVRLPDLVLTDLVMPEMDGREVARRLRELPGGASVPLIVVSADASGGQGQELLAAGADAFLSKPIDTEALLSNIVALLKLAPTYETLPGGDFSQPANAEQMAAPPLQELQLLHRLAQEGDMRQIVRWAERAFQTGEHYAGFTEQVRGLAAQYQSRAVLSLVEQHLSSG